ncbi:MAG: alpha-glucan family phosphorylase [Candidatus Sumerlaeia bacterium]
MKINAYTVAPSLPEPLKCLETLAYNLRWTWNITALTLFQRLDRNLWQETYHNPIRMLGLVKQERLEKLCHDDGFMAHMENAWKEFQDYMEGPNWFNQNYGGPEALSIAYFSFEFGIAESVPIYSGGLGVLAGDHIKASSDLGLPLIGVSLLYREGYFQQYLNQDGWQQEVYPENDFYNMPVRLLTDDDGNPVRVKVDLPGRQVAVQLWKMQVGRCNMVLLDTNVPENNPDDREITAQLYGGDAEMRIKQEIVLGIAGVRALQAAGYTPDIYHMNEGHAAFLALERTRMIMEEKKIGFNEAMEAVRASNVFTTHTPVPAGNDMFNPGLVEYYFQDYIKNLGLHLDQFLGLGRMNAHDRGESFNMTILALNHASRSNGVSELHGAVSRKMWKNNWPGVPEHEIPIDSITNGVHTRVWISMEMGNLFDRYLGPRWNQDPSDATIWDRAEEIPDAELWRTHERRRERLVAFARRRLGRQLVKRGAPESEIEMADEVLDPEALTIGFARRFALYKRGTLLLRDKDRLKKLLIDRDRPIQFLFAGKAHPNDTMAKEIIRELVHFMRDPAIRLRVVFLENYDMNVARYLMQGVDVWLNTPRRPLEASGTSGMKAAANGGLNVSILDGWWCEGYDPSNGWSIGKGEEYQDLEKQDAIESAALYDLLEKEVIPTFYDRGADGLPHGWIKKMKSAIRMSCARFSANRMVSDYVQGPYMGAASLGVNMAADDLKGAKEFAGWKKKIRENWRDVVLVDMQIPSGKEMIVGQELQVEAKLKLGKIKPEDIKVQVYHGNLNAKDEIQDSEVADLGFQESKDGVHRFAGNIPCESSGRYGFALRVVPFHESMSSPFETKLIYWA